VTGEQLMMETFLQKSYNLAAELQDLGCNRSTIIGIMSENRLEYPIVMLAAMLTGATLTGYNPIYVAGKSLELHSPGIIKFCVLYPLF